MSVFRLTKVSLKTGPSHNFDTSSLVTVPILRLLTTKSVVIKILDSIHFDAADPHTTNAYLESGQGPIFL